MRSKLGLRFLKRFDDRRGVAAGAASSAVARVVNILSTILALPLALKSLGDKQFSAFLLLVGIIAWMNLGGFGVQSALGRLIATMRPSQRERRGLLGAALTYSIGTAAITACVVAIALHAWVPGGSHQTGISRTELEQAGLTMLCLVLTQVILQVFEGIQIGNQNQYIANLCRAAGSVVSLACLYIATRGPTSLPVFIMIMNGGLIVGALINATIVARRCPPLLDISALRSQWRGLSTTGLAFIWIGVSSLFQTNMPILFYSRTADTSHIIVFGFFIRLLFAQMTILAFVTGPLWPAMIRARAEMDWPWILKHLRLGGQFVLGAGAAAGLVVALFGGKIISLWAHKPLDASLSIQILFGLYFFQMAWSHFWGVLLIGLGREKLLAAILALESVLIALFGYLGLQLDHTLGMIAGMNAALLISSNPLTLLFSIKGLRQIRSISAPRRSLRA